MLTYAAILNSLNAIDFLQIIKDFFQVEHHVVCKKSYFYFCLFSMYTYFFFFLYCTGWNLHIMLNRIAKNSHPDLGGKH